MRRKLKKRPFVEDRMPKLVKRQTIVGVIEDAKKPMIIQAPTAISNRVTRTELRKLEKETKEAAMKKTIESGSAAYDFMGGKVYVKTLKGDIIIFDMTKMSMEKINKEIKRIRKSYLR